MTRLRFHNKTFRKKARYRSMDLNRPMPSRRPRPQPQNLSSRVTRLRFHKKTFRKKARYRSMDLNRPIPSQRPRPQKPIEQSDAPSIPQQNDKSEQTDAVVASSPATITFRVAGADSARPDADAEAFDDGRRIAERSNPTTKADIVRGLSFKPVQIFLLLVFGVAIVVFLISLVIIIHHRVTALINFQLDHERPEAQAKHGWQDDRADARSSQMFVDNRRGQDGIDSPPWWMQPSVKRPQNGDATSTEPPRSSLEDVKAAPEHFKAALIYEDRTQNRDYTFMYAPSWARRKPPMVAAHETSIERPPKTMSLTPRVRRSAEILQLRTCDAMAVIPLRRSAIKARA